ncbi:MAG: PadR family transcriptional regulator [Coriobacteriales bacterium]|jgi:PadR family transcriptional regulator PadR|nr:PadR family transcriptional regulator [Coriobacteriales bacterium]
MDTHDSACAKNTAGATSEMLKGVLEGMVLEIIRQEEVYGYEIVRRLGALGFEAIAEGTVYALLARLERRRLFVISRRPSELGPPRKFYRLSDRGKKELAAFWLRWEQLAECIEQLRDNKKEG